MQLPARIGKYELEEFLGGGMSHVYRARDTVIGRPVAVKILTEAGCQDSEAKARFLAEARMAGNIAHDNVLSIYDFGEDEMHRPFMVMELLRGEDLRNAIKNGHTGELKSKLKIAIQIARALQYIHSQKIIHRDIKPENIHISASGVVKLMDFGIAKTEGLAMTRAGYVLGTPYYMAPEQVMGKDVTEQVDVYAFGILVYELMTGGKPIGGDSVERIFYSILNEPLNLEPLQQAGVPQAISDLVAKCTLKNPAERPQSFAPITEELERILADQEAPTMVMPAAQPVPPPPAGRPAWMLPAIIGVVLALGAGLYFATRGKEVPKSPEYAPTLATSTGEMVLVPEGKFLYGENKQPVSLPAFYIDKTEVTNKAYGEFCQATHRDLPDGFLEKQPDYPVVSVTLLDARDFATWAKKRLPTGREWEKAARGEDGRMYPWGNDPNLKLANVNTEGLKPVGSYPEGASPYKVLNMVGNVWELVDQISSPSDQALNYFTKVMDKPPSRDEPWYAIRGQSFNESKLEPTVIWDSTTVPSRWKRFNIGFRCVKDIQ